MQTTNANCFYAGLEKKSWAEVARLNRRKYDAPFSNYIMINPPFSRDLVFLSPGFFLTGAPLAQRRDGRGDLALSEAERLTLKVRTWHLVFGEIPFIPAPWQTRFEAPDGACGEVCCSFFHADLYYRLEVFMPQPDHPVRLRLTVENRSAKALPAVVRCHLAEITEAMLPMDYFPYRLDAELLPVENAAFDFADSIWRQRGGEPVGGVVDANGWETQYEPVLTVDQARYNPPGFDGSHHFYHVHGDQRLRRGRNFLAFSAELAPGEAKSIEWIVAMTSEADGHMADSRPDWAGGRKLALRAWRKCLRRNGTARLDLGDSEWNAVCEAQLANIFRLLAVPRHQAELLLPLQGHSNRFEIWVWEALFMLEPLIDLGYFAEVRRVLKLILSYQDAGCPPVGEFTSTAGAIGTTGPRWACTTGAALRLIARYIRHSGDRGFAREHRDALLRAAAWIAGETEARCNPPLPLAGLMPPARATDEDVGCVVSITDNYSYAGLKAILALPELRDDARYPALMNALKNYGMTLNRAIQALTGEDGRIARKFSTGGAGEFFLAKFDNICGAQELVHGTILNPCSRRMTRLIHYLERNRFHEGFCGTMDCDSHYLTNAEFTMQFCYLARGEWKKAWTAMRTVLLYGMSRDLYLSVERFSVSERMFTPFQPNGSSCGRILTMLRRGLYCEFDPPRGGRMVILLGGVSPDDWRVAPQRRIENLHTADGTVTLSTAGGRLRVEWSRPRRRGWRIRLPEHFRLSQVAAGWRAQKGNLWIAERVSGNFSAILELNSEGEVK